MITGASKGIGRSCAISLAQNPNIDKLDLCLLARNVNELETTSKLINDCIKEKDKDVHVSIHPFDLSDINNLENNVETILSQCLHRLQQQKQIQQQSTTVTSSSNDIATHYVLINNAGSLGHLGPVTMSQNTPAKLRQNVDLNVVSSCWLSSYFMRNVLNIDENQEEQNNDIVSPTLLSKSPKQCTIVNMSSLCAIQSFPTMATYCAGKAYRDMYHHTMAIEMNGNDNIKILNYAPGAIKTEMTNTLGRSNVLDSNLKEFFQEAVVRGDNDRGDEHSKNDDNGNNLNDEGESKFVNVEDTTRKLVNLILDGNYESGAHIDYWDE